MENEPIMTEAGQAPEAEQAAQKAPEAEQAAQKAPEAGEKEAAPAAQSREENAKFAALRRQQKAAEKSANPDFEAACRLRQADPALVAVQAELAQYKEKDRQQTFASDLKAIKAAFPDEKAQSVTELGGDFLRLCAFGVDPAVAYRAVRQQKADAEKRPPSTGDIGGAGKEKEFFTREEVRRMSQSEIHNHYDTIKRSQLRWDKTKG